MKRGVVISPENFSLEKWGEFKALALPAMIEMVKRGGKVTILSPSQKHALKVQKEIIKLLEAKDET